MNKKINGFLFSTLIGVLALILAPYVPFANSIVLALLIGIVIANTLRIPSKLDDGINFSSKYVLEVAIIFMGFGINFQDIANIGWEVLTILIVTILVVLLAAFYLSKLFKCRASTGYLIGFGTAICGTSAIAALAPKITDNKNEAGIAIAVVNLLGLLGMIVLPLIFNDDMQFDTAALLIGGSLHGVSNVAGAGYAINEIVGDLAITIKLGRVAMLAPAIIFFNFLINRNTSIKDNLQLPFYLVGFILATASVTFIPIPPDVIEAFRFIGKMLLTISMAAIGLNIHFNQLYSEGKIALGFGLVIFAIQLIVIGGLALLL